MVKISEFGVNRRRLIIIMRSRLPENFSRCTLYIESLSFPFNFTSLHFCCRANSVVFSLSFAHIFAKTNNIPKRLPAVLSLAIHCRTSFLFFVFFSTSWNAGSFISYFSRFLDAIYFHLGSFDAVISRCSLWSQNQMHNAFKSKRERRIFFFKFKN